MEEKNYFLAYINALIEAPLNIIFIILDIGAVIAVISWVVDDTNELLVVLAFILLVHVGHYLIFRKQQIIIIEYKGKISEIDTRIPALSISGCYDSQEGNEILISLPKLPPVPDYETLTQQEARELELKYKKPVEGSGLSSMAALSKLMQQSIGRRKKTEEEYKDECEEYLAEYERYLKNNYSRAVIDARLRSMSFKVTNTGKVPAEDIFIFIDFPDEFVFPSDEERIEIELAKQAQEAPSRPEVFTSIFVPLDSFSRMYPQIPYDFIPTLPNIDIGPPPNVQGPFIKPKDSTEISYEISKLIHGFDAELDGVEFIVSESAIGQKWEVPIRLHSSNLPKRIDSYISISVEMENL
jgi:hypothetical protein